MMKKIIFLLIFILSANFSWSSSSYHITFNKSDLTLEKKSGYDVVNIAECFSTTKTGEPQLPVKSLTLVIPANMEVKAVKILQAERQEIEGKFSVYPSQEFHTIEDSAKFFEPLAEIYNSDKPYPEKLIQLIGNGNLFGYRVVKLLLYPIQYIPSSRKLYLYTDIEFFLEFTSGATEILTPLRRTQISKTVVNRVIKNMAYNNNEVDQYAPLFNIEPFSGSESVSSTPVQENDVEYMIITNDELSNEFQTLANWKTKKGIKAKVVSLSEILPIYSGRDNAERIRNFIKQAYQDWGVTWVLLGGDTEIIPARTVAVLHGLYDALTDHYYSDLDGDWDGNRNGIFGEPSDSLDLYPDVFVGRAPVNTVAEANLFVSKTQSYEMNNSHPNYKNKILFIGTNLSVFGDGAAYCDSIDNYVPSWIQKTKLYESNGNLNKTNTLNEFNAGHNLIFIESHSSHTDLRVGRDQIQRSEMDDLTNNNKFSIFYAVNCKNNQIDQDDCFSEHAMLAADGGAVAWISSTSKDYPAGSIDQNKEFFISLFEDNIHYIGETNAYSKIPFIPLADASCYHI